MSSNRRRRRGSQSLVSTEKPVKIPRFWKVVWLIAGLLIFLAITSFTGFYAPDFYMLMIFGVVIITLNIYLLYLLIKDGKSNEPQG